VRLHQQLSYHVSYGYYVCTKDLVQPDIHMDISKYDVDYDEVEEEEKELGEVARKKLMENQVSR
jgi:hypothetical protein